MVCGSLPDNPQTEGVRASPVLGLGLLVLLAACSPATPVALPAPDASTVALSPAAPPSPPPALPPVADATGLTGQGLVAAPALRLPGAEPDGTARLEAGGRTYLLGPARRVAPGAKPALVLVLPAANTTLREEYDRYSLDALRDHGATVAVVGTHAASWNAGSCCGRAVADGVDDVAVVAAVRDDVVRRGGADAGRVAALGHSVGALMAWRLACTTSFRAAAVVAVAGTRVHPCPDPLLRLPHVLALHGSDDASIPLEGSERVVPLLGIAPPSVPRITTEVARAAGCQVAGPFTWTRCAGGGSVRLAVLPGRGHAWEDLDATRWIAAFLAQVVPGVR